MSYAELLPSPALRPWIECFWTRTDPLAPSPRAAHRVLPDGCADLVFECTRAAAIAVGTMTRPLLAASTPGARWFGVRFRPGRAVAALGLSLDALTDARAPLRSLWGDDALVERLALAPDAPSAAALVEAALRPRLASACAPDRRVLAAVARIAADPAGARVEALAADFNVSRQHLARQFARHVGVAPKVFARVARFRRALEAAQARPGPIDWAALAAEQGYYDQSHLIADYREFAGATPAAFHQVSEAT